MNARIGLCLLLLLSLNACSTVPDRYAFWRDNQPIPAGSKKPNLGDVPVPPDVKATRADIAAMRQKMESDRAASYSDTGLTENTDIVFRELAPMTSETASPLETLTAPDNDRSVAQSNSDVIYNYGSGSSTSAYNYDDAVQINHLGGLESGTGPAASNDPSVSIDWSALGGGTPVAQNTASVSGGNSLYFKFGSARIGAADRRTLQQLAQQARNGVVVTGFASQRTGLSNPVAAKDVNLRMSAQRASAVMRELAKLGVPTAQIKLVANGDSMAGGQDARDRRVDLSLH